MNIKNTFAKKVMLPFMVFSLTFPSSYAHAGLFDSFVDTVIDYFEDDLVDDLEEVAETIIDTADSADDAIVDAAEDTVDAIEIVGKITINEVGNLIDEAGNLVAEIDAQIHVSSLFTLDDSTGLPVLIDPFETTDTFTEALQKGDWDTIATGLKDDAVMIALNAGATAEQINEALQNFEETANAAFEQAGEFILDSEAIKQLEKGFEIIKDTITECVGSDEAIVSCLEDLADMFIEFYELIRHFMEKVTSLKDFASGELLEETMGIINGIERKSVKYFLPMLAENEDQLNISQTAGVFADTTEVHKGFEEYASIDAIRDAIYEPNYSYHTNPTTACARVNIPILCDDYDDLSDIAINRFNFNESNLSTDESTLRKQAFHAISVKSFGSGYRDSTEGERSSSERAAVLNYLQSELFSEIDLSQADDQRIPYIVTNEVLGGAGGAFISSDSDAILLLNEELFSDDTGLEEGFDDDDIYFARLVALEEIGHWLNWRRCQYSDDMLNCAVNAETFGDSGAKFAESSFIEYTDISDLNSQLQGISEGLWSSPTQLTLADGSTAVYEGNPSLIDIQTLLSELDSKVRFRMRTQLGTTGATLGLGSLGSSGIIEVNYTPPVRIKADLLTNMENYGYSDADQDLYLGSINITMAIENYIGASSDLIADFFILPKVYGEAGIKSSLAIKIPLLKESQTDFDFSGLTDINTSYRDDNIELSYSVSPYIFNYIQLIGFGSSNFKAALDETNSVWAGVTTSWPANTGTIPISITMAGIIIGTAGTGCASGIAAFTSMGVPITQTVQCALGSQLASGTVVSGAGALFSLFDTDITFQAGSGWVNGIRVKFSTGNAAVETRFEVLNKKWSILNDIPDVF